MKNLPTPLLDQFLVVSKQLDSVSSVDLSAFFDRLCLSLLDRSHLLKEDRSPFVDSSQSSLSIFLESAKLNLTKDELSNLLIATNIPGNVVKTLCQTYETYLERLREVLARIGWHAPQILDIDWKLSYQTTSNVKEDLERPVYTIALKVKDCDSVETRDETFQCNAEQLQDLIWKLKEASKAIEKATKVL